MHFANVEIDEKTGRPVVQGHLWIEQEALAEHDRLLLQLDSNQIWFSPVTKVARQTNGFCHVTVDGARAVIRIDLQDLHPSGLPDGKSILMARPYRAGNVWSPAHGRGRAISSFESRARFVADGLLVAIEGQLDAADGGSNSDVASVAPKLRLEAMLNWETMTAVGLNTAGPYWKYLPKSSEPPIRRAPTKKPDPHKLTDLLIGQGLTWPVVSGLLTFPSRLPGPWHGWSGPIDLFSLHFSPERLSFSDAPRTSIRENGFADSLGLNCFVNIRGFGCNLVREALGSRASMSLDAVGQGLGDLTYPTGYAMEPGDGLGRIEQQFKRLIFAATRRDDGLHLNITVELADFDPELIELHRRERNSTLKPCEGFALEVLLPAALLKLRRSLNLW